jgi:hypothetical protein
MKDQGRGSTKCTTGTRNILHDVQKSILFCLVCSGSKTRVGKEGSGVLFESFSFFQKKYERDWEHWESTQVEYTQIHVSSASIYWIWTGTGTGIGTVAVTSTRWISHLPV